MTEPIKQEIINNIFENGDKLITGPILQTVLIDMIDDVNVKDQEILSKTGSWDDAATQIPNLATKEEVTNLSESIARDLENVVDVDLTGYATEQWVESQGYLKEHQDISNLATKTELTEAENNLQGNITSLSESVARDIANVDVDLTGYATETWVQNQGYLTEHQDISGLATKTEVTNLSESVARDLASVPEGVATEAWVQSQDYASKSYVDNAVSSSSVDLTGYATETWVQSQGYLKEHQDISNLATKSELNEAENNLQGNITNLSESVASSVVWKKGTGTDSIVQKLTGDNETRTPTATSPGAVAIGSWTNASGQWSHAEGTWTNASGLASHAEGGSTKAEGSNSHAEGNYTKANGESSHAEGSYTEASGKNSHAEGYFTIASNDHEHAQGRYNHNSENQIFSIGTGNNEIDRRNAVSVLEVDNSGSYTSSLFVQNIGGYDGTNPEPGTNDLATVINGMSSGGGSSETLWEKGTGTDSIVQVIAGGTNLPTATGERAIAIGSQTTASGDYSYAEGDHTNASENSSHAEGTYTVASGMFSHAEGENTKASGYCSHAEGESTEAPYDLSHAEGGWTKTSGYCSHAEGFHTIASNESEHAQGRYNHSSTNQIFSIGTGNSNTDRRNAVSVLEVSNNDSYTSSFFVQNIGGYDGTNPTPGTNDLATVINGLSSSGGSSETLWKKGTGTDSVVQKVTDTTLTEPIASGIGAVAIGDNTRASGQASHAEGYHTVASGSHSHAEGRENTAGGTHSHAEGFNTIASNDYEHAQGIRNYNSTNQIFSVGAGDYTGNYVESSDRRRNAISVLAVPNSETQVVTASFFVQNIGGYDGTNPTPGTNDLATVLNNTETWTFTLEDGSTVTKNIRIS